jgi:phage regulator Rha-like protein
MSTPQATQASAPLDKQLPVRSQGDILTVSSRDFAAGLGIQHKHLLETIRSHLSSIEVHFGRVAFETAPLSTRGGTQLVSIAHLTEDQALFVGTLSRNSQRVVSFKATLVRSFAEARRLVSERSTAEQARRLGELEEQVRQLLNVQQRGTQTLFDLPRSSEPVPTETTRTKVQRIVNAYCQAAGQKQQDVWSKVYQQLHYRYNVRLHAYKKGERESWLDVADRTGHLSKIYAIVSAELRC